MGLLRTMATNFMIKSEKTPHLRVEEQKQTAGEETNQF